MNTTVNWSRLYAQGRCRELGISWNDEELKAIHKLVIPPEYVRDGALTKETYAFLVKEEKKSGVPLSRVSHKELLIKATKAGVDVSADTPKIVLVQELSKVAKSKKKTTKKDTKKDK